MTSRERPIHQRLHRAKSFDAKRGAAQAWASEWAAEQARLLTSLGRALETRDVRCANDAMASLQMMSVRRFGALPSVLDALLTSATAGLDEGDERLAGNYQ